MLARDQRQRERPMQIDFQCVKCEESFSLDYSDLSNDAELLRCPSCGARAPSEQVESVIEGLEELCAAIAPLRRKFTAVVEINSEDMPPPFDESPAVARKAALLDEEDSEDEDEEQGELDEERAEREESEM
jgi:hypothetical protein